MHPTMTVNEKAAASRKERRLRMAITGLAMAVVAVVIIAGIDPALAFSPR